MIIKIVRYCLLGIVNVAIIFLVVEIGLRMYTSVSPIYDLEMHKYAVELKRPGSVPGLTHEHIPNTSAKLMGVDFKINSMGFRDDELKLSEDKPNYSIMVLGCSNTVGWGVEYEAVFTSPLEAELNKRGEDAVFHVVNAGVGNYNSKLESIQLDAKIETVNPDMVVLHYYINDAEEVKSQNTGFLGRSSYLIALLKNRARYDEFSTKFEDVGTYYKSLYQADNPGWITAQESILQMEERCRSKGIDFKVMLQPDLHDLSEESQQAQCHTLISTFLESNSIAYFDLMPSYRHYLNTEGSDIKQFWVNPDDAHPNALGHQIIYKAALGFLIE